MNFDNGYKFGLFGVIIFLSYSVLIFAQTFPQPLMSTLPNSTPSFGDFPYFFANSTIQENVFYAGSSFTVVFPSPNHLVCLKQNQIPEY